MSKENENDYLKQYDKQWGSLPAEPEGPEDDPRPLRKTQLEEKDAEIDRLKNEYESLMGRFRVHVYESKQLITELANALRSLGRGEDVEPNLTDLDRRAREATKDE